MLAGSQGSSLSLSLARFAEDSTRLAQRSSPQITRPSA